ncbi:hypothetical protein ACFWYW_59360 [Nonomuraea sp. NPDC059023]|uniref:hypothetical protein n=1 Tax=unclassified Nonomuraea TaxID=2593643 RepID=UPI00367B2900
MSNPDGVLAEIDDVIEWHGSPDAMRWTADPPVVITVTVDCRFQRTVDRLEIFFAFMAEYAEWRDKVRALSSMKIRYHRRRRSRR